jgi:hypothetical protein
VRARSQFFREAAEDGLAGYVRHAFGLEELQHDQRPLRAHLAPLAKRGDRDALALLRAPLYPERCSHLIGWFFELHGRRSMGQYGPAPLSWADLYAWACLTGRKPTPWELRVLGRIDAAYFATLNARNQQADKKAG